MHGPLDYGNGANSMDAKLKGNLIMKPFGQLSREEKLELCAAAMDKDSLVRVYTVEPAKQGDFKGTVLAAIQIDTDGIDWETSLVRRTE